MLRDYQRDAIELLYDWFDKNKQGHPCLVLPTASGKSHILAALCKDALKNWPDTKVLMLTHQRELIEQNAEKMILHWPNAPLGIYSAGLGKRDIGCSITFAGIGSVLKRAKLIGHIDLIVVDESHRISGNQQGGYRKFIGELMEINPKLRVVGLTATPYRLGQGLVTDGEDSLFTDLIEPVTVSELIAKGYLSKLTSKLTNTQFNVSGVKKRAGEFVNKDLQEAVKDNLTNQQAVDEIVARGAGRKSWIVFCTGIAHAQQVTDMLADRGISAKCVTGNTPNAERAAILSGFKAGDIQAVVNCDVLTTGFDHTGIDLIALMRPTMSPGLYVQMVGRGLRIKESKDDCLVLDFSGNIQRHGPITNINPPKKPGDKAGGEAPVKECPECAELVHTSVMICPDCGYQWPEPERRYTLSDVDIMGERPLVMEVADWSWRVQKSKARGVDMIVIRYYPKELNQNSVSCFLTLNHGGPAQARAQRTLADIYSNSVKEGKRDTGASRPMDLMDIAEFMQANADMPYAVEYKVDGRYRNVINHIWSKE